MKGFNWRQEKDWERAAWVSSHVIASMTGKRYSVNKLLGRVSVQDEAEDEEEDQSGMAQTEKFEVMWARWEEKKEEKKKEMQNAKRPGDS